MERRTPSYKEKQFSLPSSGPGWLEDLPNLEVGVRKRPKAGG